MKDNILTGVYEERMPRNELKKLSKIFSFLIDSKEFTQKEYETMMLEIDRFRNMIFLDGILQNNNCFINIAYDLDIFICDNNFGILQDVKERLDQIIQSNDNRCQAFHANVNYDIFEKMKWNKHFRKATNNYKDLNGWNSPKFQEQKIGN